MRRLSRWAHRVFNHAKKYQNGNGYITDTNAQLSQFYDIDDIRLIAKAVAELENLGYIDVITVNGERRIFIEEG